MSNDWVYEDLLKALEFIHRLQAGMVENPQAEADALFDQLGNGTARRRAIENVESAKA